MISIEEAQQIVVGEVPTGPVVTVPLKEAWGRVLAKELQSPIDSPLFNASAMDGFAVSAHPSSVYKVVAFVAAGDKTEKILNAGEAARVMTGAMIPKGATAVIPQEEVLQAGDENILIADPVQPGLHIRNRGEEIRVGERVLSKNTPVTAGAAGFLASLGLLEIPVFAAPKISIFPTGSELVRHLSELQAGKIIESNSYALSSALSELKIIPHVSSPVSDTPKVMHAMLEAALNENDFVLITGGVSAGAFDHVKEILASLKVKTCFWKVAQKPGKPLYFGRKNNTFVFGLPGNPASSLVCFYEYVRPALFKWMGYPSVFLPNEKAKLSKPFSKKDERLHFVRARAFKTLEGLCIDPLEGQESHKMRAFARANCLMVVPQEAKSLQEGDEVEVHWLPEMKTGGF